MTADVENLILERLGRMDTRLDTIQADIREIKDRMGNMERQQADLLANYASLSHRLDRLETRIERIERRLDLAEA